MSVGALLRKELRRIARQEVRPMARRLRRLQSNLVKLRAELRRGARSRGEASRRRRKLKLSPARRAALKLQGQYMGYLRSLRPREKARVKALRTSKGVGAAVRLAKRLAA